MELRCGCRFGGPGLRVLLLRSILIEMLGGEIRGSRRGGCYL